MKWHIVAARTVELAVAALVFVASASAIAGNACFAASP